MKRLLSSRAIAVVKRMVSTLGASALVLAMVAVPAAADPPTVITFESTFGQRNPCTGGLEVVSYTQTTFQHFHGDRLVVRSESTVSTNTGYSGGGTATVVETDEFLVIRATDILTNEAGSRFMSRAVWVQDLATGTVMVQMNERTCLRG